jgi:hypothetical protein
MGALFNDVQIGDKSQRIGGNVRKSEARFYAQIFSEPRSYGRVEIGFHKKRPFRHMRYHERGLPASRHSG